MLKIILGSDIDGVLYPFQEALYTYFQYEMGYIGTYKEFWLDFINGKSKEEQTYIMSNPIPYDMIVPPKSVIDFLEFAKDRAEIYYITHRPLELERITRRYFRRYNLPFEDNIIFTGDKVNACRLYGVTHFIDDFPNQVVEVSKVADSYLMAKLWNSDYQDQLNTVRSLAEFRERVFA